MDIEEIEFNGTDKEVLEFTGQKEFDYVTDNNASLNIKLFGSHGLCNVPLGYTIVKVNINGTTQFGVLPCCINEFLSKLE